MRLSEALEQCELELYLDGRVWRARPVGEVPFDVRSRVALWSQALAVWWRQSPTAIRECDVCAEVSLVGTGAKRKCWRCQEGTMTPLKPKFTKPRPRGKKKKLETDQC